jgi:class 3 adenylate cyclase
MRCDQRRRDEDVVLKIPMEGMFCRKPPRRRRAWRLDSRAAFAGARPPGPALQDLIGDRARVARGPAARLDRKSFALFGAPMAHADHPQRALHAALAMQEELRRYADRLRNEGKIPVEARVGVNTGQVVVRSIQVGGHTEYTPVGHVTNLAARMQTAAPAGSIAASDATRQLREGYFEFRALGPTAVKGLDTPVEVYEVVRVGPVRTHFQLSARRGLTRFVGAMTRQLDDLLRNHPCLY